MKFSLQSAAVIRISKQCTVNTVEDLILNWRARPASGKNSFFLKLKQKSNSRVLVKTRFRTLPKMPRQTSTVIQSSRTRPLWKSNVICRKVLHNGRPGAGKLFSFDKVDSSKVYVPPEMYPRNCALKFHIARSIV